MQNKKSEILYATGNKGKFEEVASFIAEHEPTINLIQFPVELPEIQTLDQRAIAIDKAQKAWQLAQRPLLIDDAAIYFENYNQFPGTLTKFIWHGLGFEGMKKVYEEGDPAHFLLYMVYIEGPDADARELFEGQCQGQLIKPSKFTAHPSLPYDAIFKPHGSDKTYEQLRNTPEAQKHLYRLRALQKFLAWYKKRKIPC